MRREGGGEDREGGREATMSLFTACVSVIGLLRGDCMYSFIVYIANSVFTCKYSHLQVTCRSENSKSMRPCPLIQCHRNSLKTLALLNKANGLAIIIFLV